MNCENYTVSTVIDGDVCERPYGNYYLFSKGDEPPFLKLYHLARTGIWRIVGWAEKPKIEAAVNEIFADMGAMEVAYNRWHVELADTDVAMLRMASMITMTIP